jgi:hypothetical protein
MRKCACLLIVLVPLITSAQVEPLESAKKNVIKLVVSANVFYEDAMVLGYERVIGKHQSLNVFAGRVIFPNVFSRNNFINVDQQLDKGGFTIGADYRFYLQKENRFTAPRGVYIAPFVSYYQFNREWDLYSTSSAATSTANLKGEVIFLNIGGQIGYQFVVKDRFTFDFIFFGPSITNYTLNLDLQGDLTIDEENEIVDSILGRFPLLDELIADESITVNGNNSTWAAGYRFTAMIGYTFGRKKK